MERSLEAKLDFELSREYSFCLHSAQKKEFGNLVDLEEWLSYRAGAECFGAKNAEKKNVATNAASITKAATAVTGVTKGASAGGNKRVHLMAVEDEVDSGTSGKALQSTTSLPNQLTCGLGKEAHGTEFCLLWACVTNVCDCKALATNQKICYNCLSPSQLAPQFNVANACQKCRGKHHTLLHWEQR